MCHCIEKKVSNGNKLSISNVGANNFKFWIDNDLQSFETNVNEFDINKPRIIKELQQCAKDFNEERYFR